MASDGEMGKCKSLVINGKNMGSVCSVKIA
jgi:hypothetical protein